MQNICAQLTCARWLFFEFLILKSKHIATKVILFSERKCVRACACVCMFVYTLSMYKFLPSATISWVLDKIEGTDQQSFVAGIILHASPKPLRLSFYHISPPKTKCRSIHNQKENDMIYAPAKRRYMLILPLFMRGKLGTSKIDCEDKI